MALRSPAICCDKKSSNYGDDLVLQAAMDMRASSFTSKLDICS